VEETLEIFKLHPLILHIRIWDLKPKVEQDLPACYLADNKLVVTNYVGQAFIWIRKVLLFSKDGILC
jgi:hypothetical protein